MESALKLVAERGYRHVRLADIAADAGVSKATVYHYFSSKDDLLTRAVSEKLAEKQAEFEALVAAQGGSAADRLRFFLDLFWRFSLTETSGMWQRLMVSEIVTEAPALFATWGRAVIDRWSVIQRLIEEGQRNGEFRRDADAAVAARLMLSALSYQALFHVHFGLRRIAPCPTDRIFTAAVDQFIHSLSPTSVPG